MASWSPKKLIKAEKCYLVLMQLLLKVIFQTFLTQNFVIITDWTLTLSNCLVYCHAGSYASLEDMKVGKLDGVLTKIKWKLHALFKFLKLFLLKLQDIYIAS